MTTTEIKTRFLPLLAIVALAAMPTAAQAQYSVWSGGVYYDTVQYPGVVEYPQWTPSYPSSNLIQFGASDFVDPSRFNPYANMAQPGTQQQISEYIPGFGYISGTEYIGYDGLPHSNLHVLGQNGAHANIFRYAPTTTTSYSQGW